MSDEPAGASACARCAAPGPVYHAQFDQNIALLVVRFPTRAGGALCLRCAQRLAWRCSLVTLCFGAWGVISLWLWPGILRRNWRSWQRVRAQAVALAQRSGENSAP